jgi:YesN/AraC family two-component response regulator
VEGINEDLLSKITVMLVEDDDNTRKGMEQVLKKYVREIFVARDGKEGFDLFRQKNPDIVLTDIQMPKLSGIELARHIKKIDHENQVVYITAFRDSELILDAITAGADAFVIKPIDVKRLLMILTKCAKIVVAHKYAQQSTKLIQHIFDTQDHLVFLSDGKQLLSTNKRFLDFFGFDNLKDFKSKHKCVCDFFMERSGYIQKKERVNWISEAIKTKGLAKVRMFDRFSAKDRDFIVKVAPFASGDKLKRYVVSFTDITT